MPLKQHKFYVYYEGDTVYARADTRDRVVIVKCEADPNPDPKLARTAAQVAHDYVQTIVNPDHIHHEHPSVRTPDSKGNFGFHHEAFQGKISQRCEAAVRAAYAKAGVTL